MAKIKIEKKKPIWAWLLLLVLIAVLLIWLWAARDRESINGAPATTDIKERSEPATPANAREKNIAVSDFITFVKENGDRMGLDHAYTSEALVKLSEATRTVADGLNYNIQADLESVKEDASIITDDRQATVHANRLRNAAGIITDALQEIQQTHYPNLAGDLAELRSASDSIRNDVLLLDQRTEVKNYFDQAADILKNMTN